MRKGRAFKKFLAQLIPKIKNLIVSTHKFIKIIY